MRAVVQRVRWAQVDVDGACIGRIDLGLLVYLGIGHSDTPSHAAWIARRIAGLRIFPDNDGRFNHSVLDVHGSVLVVSQFTLYGDVQRGFRPSFTNAAQPERARVLYETVIDQLKREYNIPVETGQFGVMMDITCDNWGPVTIIINNDSNPRSTTYHQ